MFVLLVMCVVFLFGDIWGHKHLNPDQARDQEGRKHDDSDFEPFTEECGSIRGAELWCYVNVRPGAHSFYWLYYSTHSDGWQNRPLVLWLQGGPGASSTGYGNFEIIGPIDVDQEPRETTWVQAVNVLFVDHPVGAGYSYAETDDDFTTTTEEATEDLYVLLKEFFKRNPGFQNLELWIFGESYGGKLAVSIAERLQTGVSNGDMDCQLSGFAMGNAWIHPVASTLSWAPFLYYMSILDEYGQEQVMIEARKAEAAVEAGNWTEATHWWAQTEYTIWDYTNKINFYNILEYLEPKGSGTSEKQEDNNTSEKHGNKRKRDLGEEWDAFKSKVNLHYKKIKQSLDNLDEFKFGLKLAANTNKSLEKDLEEISGPFDPLDAIMNGMVKKKLAIVPDHVKWRAQFWDCFDKQEAHFMRPVVDVVGRMLNSYPNITAVVYQGALDLICNTKGVNDWVQMLGEYWPGLAEFNRAPRHWTVSEETGQTDMFYKAYNNLFYYWVLMAGHTVPKDQGETALKMLNRILDRTDAYP